MPTAPTAQGRRGGAEQAESEEKYWTRKKHARSLELRMNQI